jgi:ERCC4-type nuclease
LETVWVDSRTGSKELLPALRKQGLHAELTILDAGDFAFEGKGPEGDCMVGIERKTLGDLVSSLRSGRLQGRSADERSQLDRLRKTYDVIWLLVEGHYTSDRHGTLVTERGRRRIPGGYSEDSLTKAILSLELRGGLHVHRTANEAQSARWLATVFHWWTDKAWDAHTTLHTPMKHESMVPLSVFRDIVMRLPDIGVGASLAVERLCTPPGVDSHASLTKMLSMSQGDWENLEVTTPAGPRKLGNAKAVRICEAVRKLR